MQPRKIWLELKQEEGTLTRKGWKHRRVGNPPRNPKQYTAWCKRKFAWGVNRYKGTGYRAVVKASFGQLTFTCTASKLLRSRRAAKAEGIRLLEAWKSHWNMSTATQ